MSAAFIRSAPRFGGYGRGFGGQGGGYGGYGHRHSARPNLLLPLQPVLLLLPRPNQATEYGGLTIHCQLETNIPLVTWKDCS